MKKFAITTFAVLYAVLILSVSAERADEWAAREGAALAHSCSSQHNCDSGTLDKADPRLSNKKIVEPEFAVELPREAVAVQTGSGPGILVLSLEYHAVWSGRPLSSRAPPLLV